MRADRGRLPHVAGRDLRRPVSCALSRAFGLALAYTFRRTVAGAEHSFAFVSSVRRTIPVPVPAPLSSANIRTNHGGTDAPAESSADAPAHSCADGSADGSADSSADAAATRMLLVVRRLHR